MKNITNELKINQLLRLAALLGLVFSVNVSPMRMSETGKTLTKRWLGLSQREEAQSKKRELLIFLDDSEKGKEIGFTGNFLVAAIAQRVGPIIVSTSLLNNIINEETRYYFIQVYFQPNQWIIKKINNSLNLLIPVNYLQGLNIDADKVKIFDSAMNVSDVELQLGLKVNHMETIEYQSTNWTTYLENLQAKFLGYSYKSPEAPEPAFADYFINSLDDIFCKRFDYQDKTINIPEWFMYIAGHGGLLHSVAHISLEGFKKLLHFLDTKVSTNLLMLSSCYAAGMNFNKIYGEIKLGTQAYYSFPIIIQALNDAIVTSGSQIDIKGFWNKQLTLSINFDFTSFFKKAKELEGNYGEIIRSLMPYDINIENTPQIKLPGMEWLSVIDMDKKIVSIGSTLVKTKDPQKPLDVVSFFKKDPEIILLYTDSIPFGLIVNSAKMKSIVSMVSPQLTEENVIKNVYTRIKKILSTQSFSEILYWFKPVILSYGHSFMCIDEIDDKKDIIILRTGDGCMRVYYKNKEDVEFTVKLKKEELIEIKEIQFEKLDKDSEFSMYYQGFIRDRDEYSQLSEEREKKKQEISSEQVKKIEEVIAKQLEEQKERTNVSEPSVD